MWPGTSLALTETALRVASAADLARAAQPAERRRERGRLCAERTVQHILYWGSLPSAVDIARLIQAQRLKFGLAPESWASAMMLMTSHKYKDTVYDPVAGFVRKRGRVGKFDARILRDYTKKAGYQRVELFFDYAQQVIYQLAATSGEMAGRLEPVRRKDAEGNLDRTRSGALVSRRAGDFLERPTFFSIDRCRRGSVEGAVEYAEDHLLDLQDHLNRLGDQVPKLVREYRHKKIMWALVQHWEYTARGEASRDSSGPVTGGLRPVKERISLKEVVGPEGPGLVKAAAAARKSFYDRIKAEHMSGLQGGQPR